jgi:hypothetical protein
MSTAAAIPLSTPEKPGSFRILNVAVLYDSVTAGERAALALRDLRSRLTGDLALGISSFDLANLGDGQRREEVILRVRQATTIILAVGEAALSGPVQRFLDRCIAGNREITLLGFFGSAELWTIRLLHQPVDVSWPAGNTLGAIQQEGWEFAGHRHYHARAG